MKPSIVMRALISLLLTETGVLAGPPYATDDPEPTDRGRWEIYGFSSGTVFRHALANEGGFDINYGGGKNLQLSAVVSLAYGNDAGSSARVGVADTEIGAKYRFLRQRNGSWMPDVALFPKIELPTARRRFGSGKTGFSVPLWMQKDLGPWSLFGGGGWTYNPGTDNRSYGVGGIAVTRAVTRTLSLGGELFHQTADAVDSRASTGLGFWAIWQVTPSWSVLGSVGPLIQHRSAAGSYAFYVAVEFHD